MIFEGKMLLLYCYWYVFYLLNKIQDFSLECVTEQLFSYFSTKTYVVGTQKNRLNEEQSILGPRCLLLYLICQKC